MDALTSPFRYPLFDRVEFLRLEKKTRSQLELENKVLRNERRAQGIVSILRDLIRWGGLVAICYFGFRSIEVLAGKVTSSNILISIMTNLKANQYFGLLFGGGSIIYGLRQRKLRKDTVERLQARIKVLEKGIDNKRSSSKLTTRGETRPEDGS